MEGRTRYGYRRQRMRKSTDLVGPAPGLFHSGADQGLCGELYWVWPKAAPGGGGIVGGSPRESTSGGISLNILKTTMSDNDKGGDIPIWTIIIFDSDFLSDTGCCRQAISSLVIYTIYPSYPQRRLHPNPTRTHTHRSEPVRPHPHRTPILGTLHVAVDKLHTVRSTLHQVSLLLLSVLG